MEHGRGSGLEGPSSRERSPNGRSCSRLRSTLATLLLLAVPVAVLAWLVASELGTRDREQVDTQLASALRTAEAELAGRVSGADAKARALASDPRVQRAILTADRAPLAPIRRRTRGLVVVASGKQLTAVVTGDAIVRTVAVRNSAGRTLGRVGVAVTVDTDLLAALGRRAGVALLAERDGRIDTGPLTAKAKLDLRGAEAGTVDLGSHRFRASATRLPGTTDRLVAVIPSAGLDSAAAARNRDVALGALATLLTLALLAEALVPIARRRFRPRVGAGEEESIELLGSALAVAHDRAALLPLILETVVEATGAVGGALLEGGDEIASVGERPLLADPLRLALAGENGSEAVALLYPPFGGFTAADRRRAERLAAQASVAVENARQHAIARRDAMTDPLTGLANRRSFTDHLVADSSWLMAVGANQHNFTGCDGQDLLGNPTRNAWATGGF